MNHFNQQSLVLNRGGQVVFASPAAASLSLAKVLTFFLLHIPLAILMSRLPIFATFHAFAVLAIGLWWALSGKPLQRVAYVAAYLVGSEVLWRMTKALIFWEIGKYAIATIFIVALLRHQRFKPRGISLVYLALFIPAVLLTLIKVDLPEARAQISFYVSGHVALIASIWFFSALKL